MKTGDLVRSKKAKAMGVIVEIFSDLDAKNPWVRVLFTNPMETYQWCRANGLEVVSSEEEEKSK
jgi:hypothetical protein